jgi:hypothetical protein
VGGRRDLPVCRVHERDPPQVERLRIREGLVDVCFRIDPLVLGVDRKPDRVAVAEHDVRLDADLPTRVDATHQPRSPRRQGPRMAHRCSSLCTLTCSKETAVAKDKKAKPDKKSGKKGK